MGGPDFPLLIGEILATPLRQRSRAPIVYRDLRRHDYPAMRARVGRLASALTARGVRPGDTVAMLDWDSHRYLEAFFAVPMLGAVLFTVNVRLAPEQVGYTLRHAATRALICNADFQPLLAASGFDAAALPLLVARDDADCGYEVALAAADPAHEFPALDENTPATLFYTTGTTGEPKGVSFTHRQIVLHTLSEALALRFDPADVYMPMTPMFHVHAWGVPYVATMLGLKQVYAGRYTPEMLLALRAREGVTFSHCVPTVLRMLLDCPAGRDADLSGWRVTVGGAAMSQALCRDALDRGMNVLAGYGMSETCPILTLSALKPELADAPDRAVAHRVKAGLATPLVDLRVDEATGEVLARAPWLAAGYRDDAAGSAALWDGGWLHTGDVGAIDEHGYLSITDRLKDVIKTGGEWVASLTLEDVIAAHPAVAEVAVIGVPDPLWGERPLALVVLRDEAVLSAEDVRALVAARVAAGALPKLSVPDAVRFVVALPKTSVGKLDKKAMRRTFAPS